MIGMRMTPTKKRKTISTIPTPSDRTIATARQTLLAVALVLNTIAVAAGAAGSPEETVRSTADRALVVLADDSLSKAQKTSQLTTLLDGVSDFETSSKLVLARAWNDFSPEQRTEFQQLLRDYLIARYRDRVDDYAGQTVEVTGGREEARGDYTVHTKLKSPKGGDPILVDYRLRKNPAGEWRIIDVIGEGLSIVSNLRSQFQSMLARGGPDKLIRSLRDKIASGEAAKDAEKDLK
jgi:phospholipid transport system substrate-binding protein